MKLAARFQTTSWQGSRKTLSRAKRRRPVRINSMEDAADYRLDDGNGQPIFHISVFGARTESVLLVLARRQKHESGARADAAAPNGAARSLANEN
jgi:hypothetical protein